MATQTESTTVTVDDATEGTIAWVNPDNAQILDGIYATQTFSGSTILYGASIVKAGTIIIVGIRLVGSVASGTPSQWGTTLSASDINDSSFGVALQCLNRTTGETGHFLKCTGFGFSIPVVNNVIDLISIDFNTSQLGNVARSDFVEMTVTYHNAQVSNVSTMTNISTITI